MKWIKSLAFAWHGIKLCFADEPNLRIHVLAALLVFLFAILFCISAMEWLILGICITFVIAMEMINTAVENLCDIVNPENHPGIKKVKDIAAGAVLVSAIFSLLAGLIVFLPKIIFFFKSITD